MRDKGPYNLAIVCDAMPPSIVAGAIFLVGCELGLGIDKEAVGSVCLVATVTVGKTYKRMLPYREVLLKDEDTDA